MDEDGWDHQHTMPDVPGPEGLDSRAGRLHAVADRLPEAMRADFLRPGPIEIREVDPLDLFESVRADDRNHIWFRMAGAVGRPAQVQHILLAYASDMALLGSSLRPHGLTWFRRGEVMKASLDHALWLHGPLNFANWHLYTMDAPFTGGARGFNRGSIFDAQGRLVASVAQEGLMRPVKPRG